VSNNEPHLFSEVSLSLVWSTPRFCVNMTGLSRKVFF